MTSSLSSNFEDSYQFKLKMKANLMYHLLTLFLHNKHII